MPCSRTEAVRSSSPALSMARRGWFGFGSIRSRGMLRTAAGRTTVVSSALRRLRTFCESPWPRSSLSRAVAAARKSGLAKRNYLPGEFAVVVSGLGGAGVLGDRLAREGGLAELHGGPADRGTDAG